jgi:hypothetical protein
VIPNVEIISEEKMADSENVDPVSKKIIRQVRQLDRSNTVQQIGSIFIAGGILFWRLQPATGQVPPGGDQDRRRLGKSG